MGSSNLKNVTSIVNSISDHALRSAVIEFLKTSTVDLEPRKKLMNRIKKTSRTIDDSWEIFPGHRISSNNVSMIYNRGWYHCSAYAIDLLFDNKLNQKLYRKEMMAFIESSGIDSFSETDIRNTRVLSAIDSLALLAGLEFVTARRKGMTGNHFYKRLKVISSFELYDREKLETVCSFNIQKLESMLGNTLEDIV